MGYYSGLMGFINNQQGLGESQRQFNEKMKEGARQFDNSFLEGQRQYDNSFLENQRQFDTGLGEDTRRFNLGFGQDYDQMIMQALGQAFGMDQGARNSDLAAFAANQDAQGQAFGQRMGLLGFMPQAQSAPLNVTGAYGVGAGIASNNAALEQQKQSDLMNTAAQAAMMWAMWSSHDYKDKTGDIDGEEALNIVLKLPVDRWKYKGDDREHIGTYAEEFAEATGVGDGKQISVIDYLGVLTAAVQELARRAA